mmetsp:Transcript_24623/g.61505  ORF Transcript_24623/g.61505 Transcript_24623/m.61505 type:complete len:213 (+) Transcript_24623:405-1043(+)
MPVSALRVLFRGEPRTHPHLRHHRDPRRNGRLSHFQRRNGRAHHHRPLQRYPQEPRQPRIRHREPRRPGNLQGSQRAQLKHHRHAPGIPAVPKPRLGRPQPGNKLLPRRERHPDHRLRHRHRARRRDSLEPGCCGKRPGHPVQSRPLRRQLREDEGERHGGQARENPVPVQRKPQGHRPMHSLREAPLSDRKEIDVPPRQQEQPGLEQSYIL